MPPGEEVEQCVCPLVTRFRIERGKKEKKKKKARGTTRMTVVFFFRSRRSVLVPDRVAACFVVKICRYFNLDCSSVNCRRTRSRKVKPLVPKYARFEAREHYMSWQTRRTRRVWVEKKAAAARLIEHLFVVRTFCTVVSAPITWRQLTCTACDGFTALGV